MRSIKMKGLEILAFPCNQLAFQEPGTNEEIQESACTRLEAEFPIFDKIEVNGKNTAPLYKFLKSEKGGLFVNAINWNFTEFLVNKNGRVVERYAPTTPPLAIGKDIVNLIWIHVCTRVHMISTLSAYIFRFSYLIFIHSLEYT